MEKLKEIIKPISDKLIAIINSPWLYFGGVVLSLCALYGCYLDGAPWAGMLVIGWCLGCYTMLFTVTSTGGKIIDG